MLGQTDVRFKAAGPETAQARCVLLPLRVRVSRPEGEQALAEAQRVVEEFRRAAEQADLPGARLAVSDFAAGGDKQAMELVIEQASKREVRLQLVFSSVLTFEGAGDFWRRAAAIARATDFLQKFSQQPREKDIDVNVLQAKLLMEGTGKEAQRAEGAC
jgi:hypothetical protein